jgi:hypothetical protein
MMTVINLCLTGTRRKSKITRQRCSHWLHMCTKLRPSCLRGYCRSMATTPGTQAYTAMSSEPSSNRLICNVSTSDCRILVKIATFAKERADRSTRIRVWSKQSDADEIKRCENDLKRAFELFHVRTVYVSIQRLALAYTLFRLALRLRARFEPMRLKLEIERYLNVVSEQSHSLIMAT